MEILGKETSAIKFWKLQSTLMRHKVTKTTQET